MLNNDQFRIKNKTSTSLFTEPCVESVIQLPIRTLFVTKFLHGILRLKLKIIVIQIVTKLSICYFSKKLIKKYLGIT